MDEDADLDSATEADRDLDERRLRACLAAREETLAGWDADAARGALVEEDRRGP